MNELDPLEKRLGMAWQALSPPPDLETRVLERLTGSGAAATTLGQRLTARWRALRASGALGASAGAVLLGIGIALGYWIPRAPDSRPGSAANTQRAASAPLAASSMPEAPAPLAPVAEAPARASAESAAGASATSTDAGGSSDSKTAPSTPPRRAPSTPPRARAHAARPPSRSTSGDASAELALLQRAERAVRARNPTLALALIDELKQRHPRSVLQEERGAIELMAHCQAHGADAELTARQARFLERYPGTVYSSRIATECGDESSTPSPTNAGALDIDGTEGGHNVQ